MSGSAAAASLTIVPSYVLARSGNVPPSEKLNIAGIGVGGQGRSDLDNVSSENIVVILSVETSKARFP